MQIKHIFFDTSIFIKAKISSYVPDLSSLAPFTGMVNILFAMKWKMNFHEYIYLGVLKLKTSQFVILLRLSLSQLGHTIRYIHCIHLI